MASTAAIRACAWRLRTTTTESADPKGSSPTSRPCPRRNRRSSRLRRTLDVLSALLLLRATIMSRIAGDAGLPGQRASVVPVGRTGADEATLSLSRSVGPFLHEAGLYLAVDEGRGACIG